jgi:hypothetical protein
MENSPAQNFDPERLNKATAIAVIAALVSIAQIIALVSSAYANFIFSTIMIWICPIPSAVAVGAGFAGCVYTLPHTGQRKKAFISLCVGVFFCFCWIWVIYADFQLTRAFTDN